MYLPITPSSFAGIAESDSDSIARPIETQYAPQHFFPNSYPPYYPHGGPSHQLNPLVETTQDTLCSHPSGNFIRDDPPFIRISGVEQVRNLLVR